MKANIIVNLALDPESVQQLELIARDSVMTMDRLLTDIIKGFLSRSDHHSTEGEAPLDQKDEDLAALLDLADKYDELSLEVYDLKDELRIIRALLRERGC